MRLALEEHAILMRRRAELSQRQKVWQRNLAKRRGKSDQVRRAFCKGAMCLDEAAAILGFELQEIRMFVASLTKKGHLTRIGVYNRKAIYAATELAEVKFPKKSSCTVIATVV